MGGRGSSSGGIGGGIGNGKVIIHKQPEPNAQGYSYYVTGKRTVLSYWDDEGNYLKNPNKTQEDIRRRFDTKEEAIQFAKNNDLEYLNI